MNTIDESLQTKRNTIMKYSIVLEHKRNCPIIVGGFGGICK